MCGICGEWRFDGSRPRSERLHAMLEQIERRGPDAVGTFEQDAVALGHRRLSIIDLSELSSQPMRDDASGLSIVFNGSIYNYPQLREELIAKGLSFRSHGDTEVILKGFQAWGVDVVKRLTGMFAFAIWDEREQRMFMARDRMGIKPFYYSLNKQRFAWASNIQALLGLNDVDTSFDAEALHHHFTLHAVVPAPRTLFNGIRKLEPAHWAMLDKDGNWTQQCYWELNARRPAQQRSEEEWIDAIHESLKAAVDKRLKIADVPVGVLLSGGLDSSLLVGLLAEAGVKDLNTFTVGFEDQPEEKGSEFEYSDAVVERFAPKHHQFLVPNDQVLQRLPEAVANMAEPMFGQDAVAFYLLSEQVAKHIKVIQSGQGADEVFGGYFWYPRMAEEQGEYVERFRKHYFDRDHDEMERMLSSQYISRDFTAELISQRLNHAEADVFIDAVLAMDTTMLIVDDPVKRVDNMTMAWGLEARVPFLDHELVELAAQMPSELKLREGGKYALKKIARGLIPDSVIDRPKGYFPMPALKYVRGEFLDFMRGVLHSDAAKQRGLYQSDYVEQLLAAPEQYHTRIQGSKLWHLAATEFWLQTVLDPAKRY